MRISLFSFGFKHGRPEADMVLDVRFLPNPHWVPELKERSGLEAPVADHVLHSAVGQQFLAHLEPFIIFIVRSLRQAGRKDFTCAVGCTGGRHRSVAVAEHLRQTLASAAEEGDELTVAHRDIGLA